MTDTPEIAAAREALNRTQVGVRHLRVMVDAYDRLRLTLLCERGEWAPEGWEWDGYWIRRAGDGAGLVRVMRHGRGWEASSIMWSRDVLGVFMPIEALTALEAIEAADLALAALSGSDG